MNKINFNSYDIFAISTVIRIMVFKTGIALLKSRSVYLSNSLNPVVIPPAKINNTETIMIM